MKSEPKLNAKNEGGEEPGGMMDELCKEMKEEVEHVCLVYGAVGEVHRKGKYFFGTFDTE